MSTQEYRIVTADAFTRLIKVGVMLSLVANEHRGAIGFQPLSLHLHTILTVPEPEELDWGAWDMHMAAYRPERGVALFFTNAHNVNLSQGEVWTVRITALRQGGDDLRGNKKIICNVEVMKREETETEPVYEVATNMWVSELRSGRRVIETYETDACVGRVRYMDSARTDYSHEYDEYFIAVEGGDWQLVKRVCIAGTMQNERTTAESRRQSFGKLGRSISSLTQQQSYPILPEDGKTNANWN